MRVIVVRHHESGFARRLADTFDGHVVNAGDGTHAHPTQALLDLMTLRQEFGRFEGLRVAIVGDILHSRVARSNIDAVLPGLDAVMMLRIQRERISGGLLPILDDCTQRYQLNRARLRSLRNDAVILHPGPYNRGVELTDDVLDDPRSRYVAQVHNGVFVRMAVLDLLVNGAAIPA